MSTDARGQDKTTVLSTDHKHSLLSNQRRRRTIALLDKHGELDMDGLATRIAKEEFGEPLKSDERKRVYVGLYQCHVPKLIDHGVVVETERGYRLGPQAGGLLHHIDDLPRYRRATSLLRRAMGRY